MVIIMLAGVMFPLWPVKLRIGVWYLSILALGLLGALIVLAIVRLIFWCGTVVVCKKAIWMFPNLFEDVGFVSHSYSIRCEERSDTWKEEIRGEAEPPHITPHQMSDVRSRR